MHIADRVAVIALLTALVIITLFYTNDRVAFVVLDAVF